MKQMLKIFLFFFLGFSFLNSNAQFQGTLPDGLDSSTRTIVTQGKHTAFAPVDIIKVNFLISDEYCGSPKQNINTMTEAVEKLLLDRGYDKKDFVLVEENERQLGYTNASNATVMIERKYSVTLKNAADYNYVKKSLPPAGVVFELTEVLSSKMIEAEEAGLNIAFDLAKRKAESLLRHGGGKLGDVIYVTQSEGYEWGGGAYGVDDLTAKEMLINSGIKILCQVFVGFAIK